MAAVDDELFEAWMKDIDKGQDKIIELLEKINDNLSGIRTSVYELASKGQ